MTSIVWLIYTWPIYTLWQKEALVNVRKIAKYEFDDGHDVEFIPSQHKAQTFEVWVDGVFVESLPQAVRPNEARAWFYYEVHCHRLAEELESQPAPEAKTGTVIRLTPMPPTTAVVG